MSDARDHISALDRQAEREPSLAKAQWMAEKADRLRMPTQRTGPGAKLPLQLFRN